MAAAAAVTAAKAGLASDPTSDPFANHSSVPPAAVLDFFFPGLSVLTGPLQRYLHVDLNYYLPLIMFFGAIAFAWDYFSKYLYGRIEAHLMSTVEVRYDDEVYNMFMSWVACQPFAHSARRCVVNTMLGSRSHTVLRYNYYYGSDSASSADSDNDDDAQLDVAAVAAQESTMTPAELMKKRRRQKKALAYTPTFGTYYFWYRRRLVVFCRTESNSSNSLGIDQRENITLSCFGRDPSVLKELLLEARRMYLERDLQKTVIFRGSNSGSYHRIGEPTWIRCMARAPRPLSTVILNEEVKEKLLKDIRDYLDPATRRWYASRGIPYRRGYLLYGPPGTGKSSLSVALAGHFGMNIYIVSLNGTAATEEVLAQLFDNLPRKCIVLLEDIDTAGLTHTRADNKTKKAAGRSDGDTGSGSSSSLSSSSSGDSDGDSERAKRDAENKEADDRQKKKEKSGKLSLSGLLNVLDGVASQEGRLLIMTTNHIEKLDKALIRPGRVDITVKFDRADRGMTEALFKSIFGLPESDHLPMRAPSSAASANANANDKAKASGRSSSSSSVPTPAQLDAIKMDREKQQARLEAQAKEFAAAIPELTFSPAELQGYLLKHKRDPAGAIEGVKDWAAETYAAKARSERRKERRAERAEARTRRQKEKDARRKEEKREKKREKQEEEAAAARRRRKTRDAASYSDTSSDSEVEDDRKKRRTRTRTKRSKNRVATATATTAASADNDDTPASPPASERPVSSASTAPTPSASSRSTADDISEPALDAWTTVATGDGRTVSATQADKPVAVEVEVVTVQG